MVGARRAAGGRWKRATIAAGDGAARGQRGAGVDPLAHGRLLGALGTHIGRGRRVSGVRIAVFVAALERRPPLELSAELEAAHWVPLSELVRSPLASPSCPTPTCPPTRSICRTAAIWSSGYHVLDPRAAAGAARGVTADPGDRPNHDERPREAIGELDGASDSHGELSCVELLDAHEERFADRHEAVNAIVLPRFDAARAEATAADAAIARGELWARSTVCRSRPRRSWTSRGCRRPMARRSSPIASRQPTPRSSGACAVPGDPDRQDQPLGVQRLLGLRQPHLRCDPQSARPGPHGGDRRVARRPRWPRR